MTVTSNPSAAMKPAHLDQAGPVFDVFDTLGPSNQLTVPTKAAKSAPNERVKCRAPCAKPRLRKKPAALGQGEIEVLVQRHARNDALNRS